jgi:DNA-binding CsgD family transcriptional regulator
VIRDSLGAQWASFYYMDENGSPYGFRSPGIPRAFRDAYLQRGMEKDDPLHPRWLLPRQVHFLTMSEASFAGFGRVQRFQALLESFGAADAAEMIFRVDGNAVAGISLVWHSRAACAPGLVWRSAVNQQLETSAHGLSVEDLTSREREVVNAVCSGLSNAQISAQLGIRLATVKTHLVHVFDKLAVSSRGELISRMLERRPDSAGR